jgi:hypothetical protein
MSLCLFDWVCLLVVLVLVLVFDQFQSRMEQTGTVIYHLSLESRQMEANLEFNISPVRDWH